MTGFNIFPFKSR